MESPPSVGVDKSPAMVNPATISADFSANLNGKARRFPAASPVTLVCILTKRHESVQNEIQDDLQFGFTKNRSPNMASLLLNEALVEAKETKSGIAIVTLDVQKAFDTVFRDRSENIG